jgi:hypothetical protein
MLLTEGFSPIVRLISTPEFGLPLSLTVLAGIYGSTKEIVILSRRSMDGEYSLTEQIPVAQCNGKGYLRAEALCKTNKGTLHYAATSPCYFTHDE